MFLGSWLPILAELEPALLGRLPPFPDELLRREELPRAIAFASTLPAPGPRRVYWLQRWARYVGHELTAAEQDAVRGNRYRPGG